MSLRLRSDFFVAALLRRCAVEQLPAVLGRRGADEAGAIYILIDRLDGTARLLGPAPQSDIRDDGERSFRPLHSAAHIEYSVARDRLAKEQSFDPDFWLVEIEDRQGRSFVDEITVP